MVTLVVLGFGASVCGAKRVTRQNYGSCQKAYEERERERTKKDRGGRERERDRGDRLFEGFGSSVGPRGSQVLSFMCCHRRVQFYKPDLERAWAEAEG